MTGLSKLEKTKVSTVDAGIALDAWKVIRDDLPDLITGLDYLIAHQPVEAQTRLKQLMKMARESAKYSKVLDDFANDQ